MSDPTETEKQDAFPINGISLVVNNTALGQHPSLSAFLLPIGPSIITPGDYSPADRLDKLETTMLSLLSLLSRAYRAEENPVLETELTALKTQYEAYCGEVRKNDMCNVWFPGPGLR